MQNIYNDLGITENNLDNADKSAIATISRLSYIYNTEVRGRKFVGKNGQNIDSYDVLLYKWMVRNNELNNHTATPLQNIYIQNVKKYANNYNMYSIRN